MVNVGGYTESGRCNGDYEVFAFGTFEPLAQHLSPGLYGLSIDGVPELLFGDKYAQFSPIYLNDVGGVAFDDVGNEEIYSGEAPATTPEPGTIVLLATGLAAGVLLQRRVLG